MQTCFFRQFFGSVTKVDYLTLRHGFIMVSYFYYIFIYLWNRIFNFETCWMGAGAFASRKWSSFWFSKIHSKIFGRRFQSCCRYKVGPFFMSIKLIDIFFQLSNFPWYIINFLLNKLLCVNGTAAQWYGALLSCSYWLIHMVGPNSL